MRARADAVADTRRQILEAGISLWEGKATFATGLNEIADRAGVTVRTILRHFGSREGYLDALVEHARAEVVAERDAPVGDIPAAVHAIVGHYERVGDRVLRMIEDALVEESLARHVKEGRQMHRDWVRSVFGPQLGRAADAKEMEDLLVVASDVYTWKLLRRDAGHSRARTEERMLALIRRVAEEEED